MALKLFGIDHIYLSVLDMERSEVFYDSIMEALGLHKGDAPVGGEPHAHYVAPRFQLTIRPARSAQTHDPYSPGLHHLCFQTATMEDVDDCYHILKTLGLTPSKPRLYPEYHREYYATFFEDPDGIRLEIVNQTSHRRQIAERWDELGPFLNPLQALQDDGKSDI